MAEVFQRFLEQVAAGPERPAVSDNGRVLTYAELAGVVARLAALLVTGTTPPKVLILLDQGWQSYAAILAVTMAGGTYAPINTQAPMARIAMIAGLFQAETVITQKAVLDRFPGLTLPGRLVDVEGDLPAPLAAPRPGADLLYVMFTSGSTGIPKGVMVRRSNLDHFIDWTMAEIRPTPEDRWSQHPNIAFDMSQLDIFGCLGSGGTLFPLSSRRDRLLPADAIRRHRLTLWYSVPSIIGLMAQANQITPQHLASLRLMTFAGEALYPEQVERLFAARPDIDIWNTYGPTETTVICTVRKLRADTFRAFCANTVSLGDAFPGMRMELAGGPSPDEGEIVLAGPQVAAGYWGNPELTAKSFHTVQIDGRAVPAYRSGDWARRVGREMYFLRRIDDQVKVRGVRIELGEIETALRGLGFVDAVVLQHGPDLHAFLETTAAIDETRVREQLAAALLPQAVPATFHALAPFPRNDNDKVDRAALRRRLDGGG